MKFLIPRMLAVVALASLMSVAAAQTYQRGDLVWNNTATAVPGATGCLSCHTATAPLTTIRTRYATLTQQQIRTRIDMAFNGTSANNNLATGMGIYTGGTAIVATDRDALALYVGNFIGLPVAAASPAQTNALTATAGSSATTTLTLVNNGRTAFVVDANPVISGTNASDFTRMPVGAGCAAQTVAAAPGSCSETIRFAPPAGVTGLRTAQLTYTHTGTPAASTVVVLSGTATAPSTTPTPAPGGGGSSTPANTNVGAGGAVWPWALLLLAGAGLRRRR